MENSLPKYITLTEDNIDKEHICCAFSDKKCLEGYESKKEWLKKEFANGYVFRRLDARAKVLFLILQNYSEQVSLSFCKSTCSVICLLLNIIDEIIATIKANTAIPINDTCKP